MSHAIDYIDDWEKRLLGRLYVQFRDKETWQLWVTGIIAPQVQDLEDAAQTLLSVMDIDESEGAQLDRIGRIVGQPRNGVSDALYRIYLKARIRANQSTGASEDIYAVFRALFGTSAGLTLTTGWLKEFTLRVAIVLTRAEALVGVGFLRDSKESGARGIIEWQESATSLLFTLDSGPGLDVGLLAGAAQV